jgi:hypothetical protein
MEGKKFRSPKNLEKSFTLNLLPALSQTRQGQGGKMDKTSHED